MLRLLCFFSTVALYAAPCITTSSTCAEWIRFGAGPSRSLTYRSHPLDVRNDRITRALIVIHGQGRNADDYFRTGVAAAFLANALEDTIVIAPKFTSKDGKNCTDSLSENEVNWHCSGDSWRSGAASITDPKITSYDFTDEILRRLARKDLFPYLRAIVVSGHSAGGQYVSRYLMANTVDGKLGVPVSYVVSNPSSYAYLDASRPSSTDDCSGAFDNWPYGLKKRSGYAAAVSDEDLKHNLAARRVTFLLGELDTLPIAGFDSSCPAMSQGPSRFARGQSYAEYVNKNYGAKVKVTPVPLCGHNARCMFTADPALSVLFP